MTGYNKPFIYLFFHDEFLGANAAITNPPPQRPQGAVVADAAGV